MSADHIYVADTQESVIRIVDKVSGIISAYAGSGSTGHSPNGTAYASVNMTEPVDIVHLTGTAVLFTNTGESCVQKLENGIVTDIVGQCGLGGPTAGDGGFADDATIQDPNGLCYDPAGDLYVLDFGNSQIRKVMAQTNFISTFAGNGTDGYDASLDGGSALLAPISPASCAFDDAGNMYVTSFLHHVIQKITPAGIISTVAGNGTAGSTGDGGLATAALVGEPIGIAVDRITNNLYFADHGNDVLRKIDLTTGIITTIAGEIGISGTSGDDGLAVDALLTQPDSVAVDNGEIYIALGYNGDHRIRKIGTNGIITTVVGTGTAGNTGNGGLATAAKIGQPFSFFYWWNF